MAKTTTIEWTEASWNPVTGCSKISIGCQNCYAERMAKRLKAMHHPHYRHGFRICTHEDMLQLPLQWKRPLVVFVNSMGDLFHENVPEGFIVRVFEAMRRASWHTYQVLTKRARRLLSMDESLDWPDNVWMGVSVETQTYVDRIDYLRKTHARLKFVSFEPLLGPIPELDLSHVDWAIVGGESGPGARLMKKAWVIDIKARCRSAGVPFFFKQWGGANKKTKGRLLNGRTWEEMPDSLSCRGRRDAEFFAPTLSTPASDR